MTTRTDLFRCLSERIGASSGRTIVAIDGVDEAGKTTFADELAPILAERGRSVIRASVDGFHNNRALRYRRGRSSPEGFFLDSYNYADLNRFLLDPFREGSEIVHPARFDHVTDTEISTELRVPPAAILLIDGIFLHRDELYRLWDFSVFLSVPFSVSYARMAARDRTNSSPLAEENRRYYEGQQIYLRNCEPDKRAAVVIDNSVLDAPKLMSKPARPSKAHMADRAESGLPSQ